MRGKEMMVACYERADFGSQGQRRFISCTPREFFFYYFQLPPNRRNHYEVIGEGRPCKLYFDLEFMYHQNAHVKSPPSLVKVLIQVVNDHLALLGYPRAKDEDILDLDSSTNEKFSRHLVFTRTVFENNEHAGYFVRETVSEIEKCFKTLSENDENHDLVEVFSYNRKKCDLTAMFIEEEGKPRHPFIDLAVYSKNRNFRMFMSTKLNKDRYLVESEENTYVPVLRGGKEADADFDKQIKEGYIVDVRPELFRKFLDSLITNIDWAMGENEMIQMELSSSICSSLGSQESSSSVCSFDKCSWKKSEAFLYPEIELHITDFLSRQSGLNVYFKKCGMFNGSEIIFYEVGNNYRYCGNVGRFHKSNRIYICVDIQKCEFYQKCFDPDCRSYQGNRVPFPAPLLPWAGLEEQLFDDWANDEF